MCLLRASLSLLFMRNTTQNGPGHSTLAIVLKDRINLASNHPNIAEHLHYSGKVHAIISRYSAIV